MMYRAAHLAFKDLGGVLIFLNDQIHAYQTRGQARVLAATTDGLRQVFLADGQTSLFLLVVDLDREHFDGLERLTDEFGGIRFPADDVHLLIVQLTHDVLHTRTT
jgi:hypothetical protein